MEKLMMMGRRTMRTRQSRAVVCAGLLMLGSATSGLAQSGDFGGSFDPGPGTVTPPPPPIIPPAGGGDFGGSFDDGGSFPTPPDGGGNVPTPTPTPTPTPAPTPPVVGGDDFGPDGGSFDPPVVDGGGSFDPPVVDGGGGGGIVVAPTPPQPPPVPPTPAPQPPQVDPQIAAFEQRDFGVPPTGNLRAGQFHGPTPTAVPGAKTVGTGALSQAMSGGTRIVLIDVLGGQYSRPGAMMAPAMASPGSFSDQIQQQTAQWLVQLSGGDRNIPIVIYCSGPECWLSYNAVLRAVAAGYGNVYWYRGGTDAWQMAGLPLRPAGF